MKKLIALMLVVLTVLSVFSGCGGGSDEIVLPKQNVEDTYENRQKAMVEIAKAYYYKNPYVQYDEEPLTPAGRTLGVRNASDMNNTPEMAGPQRTIYHVCSFFTYITTFHTFDYKILGAWEKSYITPIATKSDNEIAQYVVFQHTNEGHTQEENVAALEQARQILQPGDLLYYNRTKSGSNHVVMWCGDLDGDGDMDMLNADGTYYNSEDMEEKREELGGIDMNTDRWDCPSAEQFFFEPGILDYLPGLKAYSIVRFADKADTLPLTERAKTRLLYPDLVTFFEVEGGIYGAVPKGGELTYTLTLENRSQQDHKGILLQLPVPENAEIIKVNGAAAKNKTVKLNLDLPAGSKAAITYTVKATGSVGDVIKSGTGYVHAIPLPNLNTTITSGAVDAAAVKTAIEANKTLSGEAFLAAYLKSMGYDLPAPTANGLISAFYDRKSFGDYKLYWPKDAADVAEEDKLLAKMQIPDFFGGQSVATNSDHLRVKELRAEDLQAGDILLWQNDKVSEPLAAVHNGENLVCAVNGQLVTLSQYDLDKFIMYHYFIALRPSAAI